MATDVSKSRYVVLGVTFLGSEEACLQENLTGKDSTDIQDSSQDPDSPP